MSFLAAAIAGGHPSSTLSNVEPGVLGFLVVAGIGLVLVFLLRNMNKQFKKLGPPPGEPGARPGDGAKPGDKAEGATKRE